MASSGSNGSDEAFAFVLFSIFVKNVLPLLPRSIIIMQDKTMAHFTPCASGHKYYYHLSLAET